MLNIRCMRHTWRILDGRAKSHPAQDHCEDRSPSDFTGPYLCAYGIECVGQLDTIREPSDTILQTTRKAGGFFSCAARSKHHCRPRICVMMKTTLGGNCDGYFEGFFSPTSYSFHAPDQSPKRSTQFYRRWKSRDWSLSLPCTDVL